MTDSAISILNDVDVVEYGRCTRFLRKQVDSGYKSDEVFRNLVNWKKLYKYRKSFPENNF